MPAEPIITIRGLDEVIQRMEQYPDELHKGMEAAMDATMLVLWENVPPYPPPPDNSSYRRTGTLGRTLGSSMSGGKSGGEPDIYEVRPIGSGFEGRFGTRLEYAPYVIGDDTQAWMHYQWWTISTVAIRATAKITKLWQLLGEKMARFLDGKK